MKEIGIEVIVDNNLVRGLDYYTGVVFEYHAEKVEGLANVGALGGGGHYAKLLKEVGGPDLEGVGLAFGIERLAYVYTPVHGSKYANIGPDFYLIGLNQEIIDKNFSLADMLRSKGFVIDTNYQVKSVGSLLKLAVKKNAKFAIIIGEEEMEKGRVNVKNLRSQTQTSVELEDLAQTLESLIIEYEEESAKLALEDVK